jgi:hypothetical protein
VLTKLLNITYEFGHFAVLLTSNFRFPIRPEAESYSLYYKYFTIVMTVGGTIKTTTTIVIDNPS